MKTVEEMQTMKDDIERNIRLAVNPSGSLPDLRARDRAAGFLLTQGDLAYRSLTEILLEKPDGFEASRLIELIGFFKRDESAALLKPFLLQGRPGTARAAGMALAALKCSTASLALKDGLLSDVTETRIAAIDGVRLSGDTSWCSLLGVVLQDSDPNIRYYAVNSAATLGCLDAGRLKDIRDQDVDEHVRLLASNWLKASGLS